MYEEIKSDLHWLMLFCFFSGFIFAFACCLFEPKRKKTKKKKSKNIKELQDLYCYECEIEMPVKEKKGRLYCTNCKLIHKNQYV